MGLIIDNFAGGGGASTGIEAGAGRIIDIAINHDPEAVAMHAANHPGTLHHCQSVWRADPLEVTGGRPVDLAWFSPDCKHFSKAKGGKPVEKHIRDLAWVVVLWAKRVKPAIIMLENVEEFRTWGPIAEDGKPCPKGKGETFLKWTAELRRAGYHIQWRELRACDYGAPTSRKRLFMIARRDGLPIVWPEPTHGKPDSREVFLGQRLPYRTAADIIDWSIPCPSIFERARPLKDATCRRIATGIMRYVVNSAKPFIVPITHTKNAPTAHSLDDPLRTITTAKGGEMALISPTLVQIGYGERAGQTPRALDIEKPLGTVVAGGGKHAFVAAFLEKFSENSRGRPADAPLDTVMAGAPRHAVVAVHMAQHNGGVVGGPVARPLSTIVSRGTQQQVVASSLVKLRGTSKAGQAADEPLHTISAGGTHFAAVSAFLVKYYGDHHNAQRADDPLHTITTKERFGLVTVTIEGEEYAIADIGMRMLSARELARAQGFPDDYILEPVVDGKPLTKTAQIRMIGNSVCPDLSEALVRVNLPASADAARDAA